MEDFALANVTYYLLLLLLTVTNEWSVISHLYNFVRVLLVQKQPRGRYYLSARTVAEFEPYILDQFAVAKCNMCQKLCVQVVMLRSTVISGQLVTLKNHPVHSTELFG